MTKLSLLLKCLEGETPASIQHALGLERVLPTIDQNIRVGNSLVETDFYDSALDFAPGTEKTVKPFSWRDEFAAVFKQGGFDAVIGNPPYVFGRDWKSLGIDVGTKNYFMGKYETVRYQQDMFTLFMEKSFQLAHKKGIIGMIVPNVWLTNTFCSPLRQFILTNSTSFKLVVPQENPFPKLSVDTLVFLSETGSTATSSIEIVSVSEKDMTVEHPIATLKAADYVDGNAPISTVTTAASAGIIDKIMAAPLRLGDLADMTRGVHPYRTGGFGKSAFASGTQTERDVQERPYHSAKPQKGYRPFIYGRDLKRFTPVSASDYVHYGDWLAEPRNPRFFTGERVYSRKILGERLIVTLEKGNSVVDQQVYITIPKTENVSAAFLAAVIGSKLAAFFIKNYYDELNDAFPQVKIGQLKALPIPKLDLKKPAAQQHDEVVRLVEQLLAGYTGLSMYTLTADKEQAQARLRHLERRLDELVYALYGLTAAEIAHVEG